MRVGEEVIHERHGIGVIVNRWGSIPVPKIDPKTGRPKVKDGKVAVILANCSEIVDVEFDDGRTHSCREAYLKPIG